MQILAIGGPYPTAPVNAPTSLSAIPTNTSVAISFTAPTNDGGTPITNYEYSFNGSSWTAISPADATSPVTVSGLTQNTGYTVYLRAVNIVGSGPSSAGVSFTTEGVPTGTATITSVPVGTTTATVNFTVSAGGGAITGYDLYVANQTNAWNNTTASPISVTGLTANTTYTFYVRAKNAYGVGPQSAGFNATTNKVAPSSIEYLLVGAGGGGGNSRGGGGGAGQVLNSTASVAGGSTYTITINAGGVGGSGGFAGAGGTTVMSSVATANGGGAGVNNIGTGGTSGNGFGGGAGVSPDGGGGGGGAGQAGASGSTRNGGNGVASSISGSSVTRGGGGAGGGDWNYSAGAGGAGGGGNANTPGANGSPGAANTGGGGGGGGYNAGVFIGAAGGNGVVVIAYSQNFTAAVSTTGSPSYSSTSRSGFHVYTFTGSGSITF